jgi:hypothetical protein
MKPKPATAASKKRAPHRVPAKPKYTLEELVAQCDPGASRSGEANEWINMRHVGTERTK